MRDAHRLLNYGTGRSATPMRMIAAQLGTDDPELIDAVAVLAHAIQSVPTDYATLRQRAELNQNPDTNTPEPELPLSAEASPLLTRKSRST